MWLIVSIILSGAVGYLVGAANTFRRQKLGVYEESLPIIIKTAFRRPDPFNGEIGPSVTCPSPYYTPRCVAASERLGKYFGGSGLRFFNL